MGFAAIRRSVSRLACQLLCFSSLNVYLFAGLGRELSEGRIMEISLTD